MCHTKMSEATKDDHISFYHCLTIENVHNKTKKKHVGGEQAVHRKVINCYD